MISHLEGRGGGWPSVRKCENGGRGVSGKCDLTLFTPIFSGFGEEKKFLLKNKLVLTVSKHMHLFL